ncbi:MAG: hypothetical protein J7549_05825 [Variovorax sp.]|nr:hypothetical protein [Variovorax sp.]
MIFSGNELLAIKVVAVATPVAGLAAFAHVRARRRRARAMSAEGTRKRTRSLVIEVRESEATGAGFVSIELTPHLLACLAAANSARLRGYPTPDSVMVAPAVMATWKTLGKRDLEEVELASKLIVTREFVKVRSSSRTLESVRVPLGELLRAHGRLPEGQALYCAAEGDDPSDAVRVRRIAPAGASKDFYWVRQGAGQPAAPAIRAKRDN